MSDQELQGDFRTVSYFILESLKTLGRSVEALQKSLTALEISIVSKSDLKDLRDHSESRFQIQADRMGKLESDVIVLKVQAGAIGVIAGAIAAAVVSLGIKKLGG